MSGSINKGLTLPTAINNSEIMYQKFLRSAVANNSRIKDLLKLHRPSALLRAELIHLGNVRTRSILTTRNVNIQDDMIHASRSVMEEKNQEKQHHNSLEPKENLSLAPDINKNSIETNKKGINPTLSKITNKLTSLFSKKNSLEQTTNQLQRAMDVTNPVLDNQNIYPIAGNIAVSTETNTAISLQAGETPAEAAINIINLNSAELTQQLPVALNQSLETLHKIGEQTTQRPMNASLL